MTGKIAGMLLSLPSVRSPNNKASYRKLQQTCKVYSTANNHIFMYYALALMVQSEQEKFKQRMNVLWFLGRCWKVCAAADCSDSTVGWRSCQRWEKSFHTKSRHASLLSVHEHCKKSAKLLHFMSGHCQYYIYNRVVDVQDVGNRTCSLFPCLVFNVITEHCLPLSPARAVLSK